MDLKYCRSARLLAGPMPGISSRALWTLALPVGLILRLGLLLADPLHYEVSDEDVELSRRIDEYMEEFEENGLNNVSVNKE